MVNVSSIGWGVTQNPNKPTLSQGVKGLTCAVQGFGSQFGTVGFCGYFGSRLCAHGGQEVVLWFKLQAAFVRQRVVRLRAGMSR